MTEYSYLNFENRFRGDSRSILKKFKNYDSLIDIIITNKNRPRLLDIGCGRGEWLGYIKDRIPDYYDEMTLSLCIKHLM